MPMIRYQVRNEYGLADPELYRASGRDDPEALLEGVAMAGLVGVLRQLGDLAEFAAEIFHELHEEVMATAARGHGLMVRVQQLEAEFPSIEKAFFSQTSHSHFAHNAGIDWHANLRIDQNLITRGDMPRFILDSYEECRGPPRLFMLDKFDIAGAGTCLKRYSDPSFFKMELASSGTMEAEVQREKKVRKIKKKVSHWKNDEVEFSLAPRINSNLQPGIPEQAPETKPTRRVKLKSRHLTAMDTSSRRSYMESLLEVHSAEQEVQLENSLSQTNIKMESIESAPEVHEILIDNSDKYPSFSEKKTTQPPTKQITEAPTNGLENQKIKGEGILEILPQSFDGVQKMYIDYQVVVKKETSAESENKTERSDISYRSNDAENYTPAQLVSQNTLLDDVQCITEDFAEVSRPDDIGSEADSFMDALNIMESEIETDSESRVKSDAGLFSMESQAVLFNNNKGQQELLAHISGPDPVDNSMAQLGMENIQDEGMPSVSISNKLGNLDDSQPSWQKMISFDVNANSEACPGDTQDTSSEKLWGNGEAMKLKSQVNLLSDGTCHDKASAIPNSRSEIGEASSNSCVSDLTCAIIHLCPEGSFDQAQSVASDSNEISSCDVKSDDKGAGHLDGNAPCAAETFETSQLNGSPLRSRYLSGETRHPPEHVEELISEDIAVIVDMPNPIFLKKDGRILEQLPTGYVDDTEGCSGGIISRTASSYYTETSSTIGLDGLASETKNVMQPEDLAGEISPGCVTGIYEVVEHLDGNAPCAAETSEASQLNGSPLRSRYLSGEPHHPPEHVEELISEDIAVVVDVPNPIFPKKDGHILEQLPTGYVDDTEGCSGGIISRSASSCYPEISSTIVPDGLAAETKNVMQPEDLAGEISPGCVTGIYEVVECLDGNAPCAAETSEASQLNGSPLRSRYLSGETHHTPEYVEELISEDIAVVVDVPNPIFPKKDGRILELPTDYVDDTEGCSGGIISRTASSRYPGISSTVVGPDGLAAETENVMQPEDLAAEISPGFVTGSHTGGIAVRKNALPSEDDEEINSSQTQSTTLLEEPSAGYIEDSPHSLTLQLGREPQELIERDTEYISPVTSHITMQPAGLAVETENSVAPDEELECSQPAGGLPNTEEIVESEIRLPHILPLESKCLLDVEPQEFRDAESAEFAPLYSGKETVPDDMQLQSNSEVIDGPVPVGDYLRLSFEYTDLHSDALQIEQHIQCDDSLIKSVTDEAVIDYHETSSQEDCVPGDTDLNQYNFDITEPSSPNNRTESYSERALCTPLSPRDESLPISASAVSSSEFFNQDLSDSSDARLFNGICHTMPSEHPETDLSLSVAEEILFYSLETGEDFSSRVFNESVKEGISSSLEEAPKAHAGDESNEMSSYQDGERLEPSDLRFEITQSVDQDIIQSNSVEPSDQGSEADSHIMVIDQNISELDIRSSNTWQLEPEASAPSEFSYEQSVIPSPNSSAAGLPLFASFGLAISESTPEQFSETQISDTVSSFQLQDLHEAPPLPPLPPLEWRLVKARPGCLTSDGNLVQPLAGTNPFAGVSVDAEIIAPLPPLKDNRSQCGSLGLHNEKVWPLRLSELPPIVEDERHQHCIQEEAVHSTDPSVLVSPIEDDKHLHSHLQPSNPFLPLQSPEDGVSQHLHRLPVEKIQPSEDNGPQLVQLPSSLEVERSQHGNLTIAREIMESTSPFFIESSVEDEMYRYNYGAYGAENMQHLNWSVPLLTSGPMMQHHGLISSVDENPFSPYDDSVPSSGDEKPNGKLRSIRNRPRHPLIDAVAAHDKSKLRKVSELVQPSTRPKADERDTLLEQIRNKCFNLKPAAATRPNIKGPPTNLKVAAILEKANAIRQACVGSDEDEDNGDGWSDS